MAVFRSIPCLHNAAFHNLTGIYAGSEKAADFTITPYVGRYPSIVFECGWSESLSRLRQEKDLWFGGCGGFLELVILIKFNKLAGGSVSGMIEVWAGESATNNRLIQTEVIANLPRKHKKTAADCCRRSFLPGPASLILLSSFESPDRSFLGVRYFLGATPGMS